MKKPSLFIASSVEGLPVAEAINLNLDHDTHATLWRTGTFKIGSVALEDIVKKSSQVDFAVFVFTPDDVTTIRNKEMLVARDNVVFEMGLFIGSLGKERCYVVKPRGVEMHLPSDLVGVTPADYDPQRPDGDIASALNAACTLIKDRIHNLGGIPRSVFVSAQSPSMHIANPPDYKLNDADLLFLAQCARSHVARPIGLSFHSIESELKGVNSHAVAVSAIKLLKLGHVEKTIESDAHGYDDYFAYRATENGLETFLKNEERYADIPKPIVSTKRAKSGFEDMSDDIPF